MQVINTADLDISNIHPNTQYYLYNGLDSALTLEIENALCPMHGPDTGRVYKFERALQSPVLAMDQRGILIDKTRKFELFREKNKTAEFLEAWFRRQTFAICGKAVNPRSSTQLMELFYRTLHCTPQYTIAKGDKKLSANRVSLEKLLTLHHSLSHLIRTLLKLRDLEKELAVLKSLKKSRFYTSYNIAGTDTGRWSSSTSVFGLGTNAQNIAPAMREIFVADPGYKLCYMDLEQAESRTVAYLSQDIAYIEACESGDLHTTVTRMIWPELAWTGILEEDQQTARQKFYRDFSYRDMAKRGGHATNYYGTPRTIASHLHMDLGVIQHFQDAYFAAFPQIKLWHSSISAALAENSFLITPLGRKRFFFSRLDDSTLRKAIAFTPQSTIGDLLNLSLYRFWQRFDSPSCQLLGQLHDAILFQYKDPAILPEVQEHCTIPVIVNKRRMVIPFELKVGYNWRDLALPGSEKEKAQEPPRENSATNLLNLPAA